MKYYSDKIKEATLRVLLHMPVLLHMGVLPVMQSTWHLLPSTPVVVITDEATAEATTSGTLKR